MLKLTALLPGLGVGVVVGTLSGLLGIGGGILMVPALIFLWHHDAKLAIGTSLAVMIPTALAGTLRNAHYGTVDWRTAFLLGAPLAHRLDSEMLKKLFGIIMVVSGLQVAGAFEAVGKLWK